MQIEHSPYSGYKLEFYQMRELLIGSIGKHNEPLNWLIGRLDNWRYASCTKIIRKQPDFFTDNAHLWKDFSGRLLGFFISEGGKNNFELQVDPDHRQIESEMLSWVLENWAAGRNKIVTAVYEQDAYRQ